MTYRVLWFSRERYRSNSGPGGRFYASVPLTKGGTGLSLQTYNFSMTTSGRRWHIGFTFGKNAEVADSAMTPGHATGPLRNPRWNEDKVPSMVMNFLYRMDLLHRLDFPIFRTEHHKKTSAVIHRGSKTMSFKNDQARDDLRVPNQHSLTFHCKKIEMADLCAYSSKRSFLVDSQTRSRSSKHPDQGSSFQGPPASTFHRPHTTMMPLFHRRFGTAGCHQLQQRLDRLQRRRTSSSPLDGRRKLDNGLSFSRRHYTSNCNPRLAPVPPRRRGKLLEMEEYEAFCKEQQQQKQQGQKTTRFSSPAVVEEKEHWEPWEPVFYFGILPILIWCGLIYFTPGMKEEFYEEMGWQTQQPPQEPNDTDDDEDAATANEVAATTTTSGPNER
jgi:hypothetical protein